MYDEHLLNGTDTVTPLVEDSVSSLLGPGAPQLTVNATLMHTLLHDVSASVSVVVFNPTSWTLSRFVTVPCFQTNLIVMDASGSVVPFDVLPANATTPGTCQVVGTCGHPTVPSPYVLHFAVRVSGIGFQTYFVSVNSSMSANEATYTVSSSVFSVSNGLIEIVIDSTTMRLSQLNHLASSVSVDVTQDFLEYNATGDIDIGKVTEGAYIFIPKAPATPVVDQPFSYEVVQGRFVSEIRQKFTAPCNASKVGYKPLISCGIEQTYRLNAGSMVVEVLTSVGPLAGNKDFVSRYSSSISSGGLFSSDDNCFVSHQRTYNPSLNNSIGGNYYPFTCACFINDPDQDVQLTFLSGSNDLMNRLSYEFPSA